jgi:hypothetical protein
MSSTCCTLLLPLLSLPLFPRPVVGRINGSSNTPANAVPVNPRVSFMRCPPPWLNACVDSCSLWHAHERSAGTRMVAEVTCGCLCKIALLLRNSYVKIWRADPPRQNQDAAIFRLLRRPSVGASQSSDSGNGFHRVLAFCAFPNRGRLNPSSIVASSE